MSLIRLLLALAVLYLPVLGLTRLLIPDRAGRAIWAGTLCLALVVFLSVAAGYIHFYLFFTAWAFALAAVLAGTARRWRTHGHSGHRALAPAVDEPPEGTDRWLLAILLLVLASRLVVAVVHELPPGWDPTFHLVLARKILDARAMIDDWSPFEEVALNYPVGSHALVAVLAAATRLPLHTVFNLLIPVLGVLTTAQVYLLAKRATQSREVALYAATAYGFWANWGSLDYYRWGGMPNLVGMSLLTGALTLLVMPQFGRRERALFGLLVAAIALTHHHVMVTAGVLFAALFAYYLLRGDRERAGGLVAGIAFAALLASFYIVPYALKAGGIGDTFVLTASEPPIPADRLIRSVGGVLLLFGIAGSLLAGFSRSGPRPAGLVWVVSLMLLTLFVSLHYAYPAFTAWKFGEARIPFTPSRFLTDLAYVLPIFAGYAVYRVRLACRAPSGVAVLAMLLLSLTLYPVWRHLYTIPAIQQPTWEAYSWIQGHTEPDAIVLDRGRWSVYGTWRRTALTSLPVSEPSTAGTSKRRLIELLEEADAGRRSARPAEAGATQVLAIRQAPTGNKYERVLWRHASGLAVVELWPRQGPGSAANDRNP